MAENRKFKEACKDIGGKYNYNEEEDSQKCKFDFGKHSELEYNHNLFGEETGLFRSLVDDKIITDRLSPIRKVIRYRNKVCLSDDEDNRICVAQASEEGSD